MTNRSANSSRLDEWEMAGRAVAQRPMLGAGPEGYRTVVEEVVTADYERRFGREVQPDRAHNGVLDVATTTGVPGALGYSVLLGGVLLEAWRSLRRRVMPGLALGVIAYVAQQMLLFPLAEADPLLWIAAGVLLGQPEPTIVVDSQLRRPVAVVAALLTAVLFVTGVLGVAADRAASQLTLAGADRATICVPT